MNSHDGFLLVWLLILVISSIALTGRGGPRRSGLPRWWRKKL